MLGLDLYPAVYSWRLAQCVVNRARLECCFEKRPLLLCVFPLERHRHVNLLDPEMPLARIEGSVRQRVGLGRQPDLDLAKLEVVLPRYTLQRPDSSTPERAQYE